MRHHCTTTLHQSDLFEIKVEPVAGEKRCGGCDTVKVIEEFSWNAHINGRSYRTSRCRECKAKAMKAWTSRPGNKNRRKLIRYGMTPADYDAMLAAQNGACAVCGDTEMPRDPRTAKPYDLAVDHCHESGKVRALFCPLCNNGLGCFKDDVGRLHLAIKYLERFKAQSA